MTRHILLIFFIAIGIAGLWHGFPLIDIYADEMYFVYGPLASFHARSFLPIGVPYGTVTFYADMLLQGMFLTGLFAYSSFDLTAMTTLVMTHPFLVYIPPRVLNLVFFLAIVWLTMRRLRIGQKNAAPYAIPLTLILCGNLVLLTFMHSGKMWITCILLLFLAGHFLSSKRYRSMFAAALAFANLPLMGIFWLITMTFHVLSGPGRRMRWLLLIACGVPLLLFSLNTKEIFAQVQSVLFGYIAPSTTSIGETAFLYGKTLGAYVMKILLTSPFVVILGLLALRTRARVTDPLLFRFSMLSIGAYLAVISVMFWSADLPSFFRYLLPFQILFLLLFTALEFPVTKLNTIGIRTMGILSAHLAIISTITLMLPTTEVQAYRTILRDWNTPNTIILSNVRGLSFPTSSRAAELIEQEVPGRCGYRCKYALTHSIETAFLGVEIPVKTDAEELKEIATRMAQEQPSARLVLVIQREEDFRSVERGIGNYFIPEAWWPMTLGPGIVMEEWSK